VGSAAHGRDVLCVDDDAPLGGDGRTWETAFCFLQDALAEAVFSGGTVTEIRVAEGVYKPDRDALHPTGTGDRTATFMLLEWVELLGGYAGMGAPDPDKRDSGIFETVLSGDLLGNDGDNFENYEENSHHVVTSPLSSGFPYTEEFVIDGFTITAGNADGMGGGVLAEDDSFILIRDCTVARNMATYGGGVGGGWFVVIDIVDSRIVDNLAISGGGGLYVDWGAEPWLQTTISRCRIENNTVVDGPGGGLCFIYETAYAIHASRISGNWATRGGGLYDDYGWSGIDNCQITGNVAYEDGGGVWWSDVIGATTNSTMSGNAAVSGGAIYSTLHICIGSDLFLSNNILWDNVADPALGPELALVGDFYGGACGEMTVAYSDVKGDRAGVYIAPTPVPYPLVWGPANIDVDPRFAISAVAQERLPETRPVFAASTNGDYRLAPNSPCIDAGDNTAVPPWVTTDLDGRPRFHDDPGTPDTGHAGPFGGQGIVDMGPYEFQDVSCLPDVNADATVNDLDLEAVLLAWGPCAGCPEDVNRDGVVNALDLLEVLGTWGACP
jgi:hypothetical protein